MGAIKLKKQSAASAPVPATDQLSLFVDSADDILKTKDSFGVIRPSGVGTADELATTGAPVDVSASAPPTIGQVLIATSTTSAAWGSAPSTAADALGTTGADVQIGTSAPPSIGQVLIATSSTVASWQTLTVGLAPTASQTGAISASVGQLVEVDVSGGVATVTLPVAPPHGSQVGVKVVTSATNICTIAAGAGDLVEFSSTMDLTTNFEWAILIYDSPNLNWLQIG